MGAQPRPLASPPAARHLQCGGCGAAAALGQARPVDLIAPPHDFCCAFGAGQYYAGGAASSAAEF